MRFAAVVEVGALEGIADPEAATIERALPLLGFDSVEHLRAGRIFRFVVEAGDAAAAQATAEELAHRLLANPVIQRAEVAVRPLGEGAA
ncbi:MAG TPA: phosphoribosylformylglycinamidine synthase subunit PurS [Acidimicrobiales bacterium]|nr:phosphoribosylformylglycinamidine synthase subunit PurS [Acidimicrobiales bacterium]